LNKQTYRGHVFVVFVLTEHRLCWGHVQDSEKRLELSPEAKGAHCIIHRYALASKTLPTTLQTVLD